jgi:hypothetical protein
MHDMPTTPIRSARSRLLALSLAAAAACGLLAGCYAEGGLGYSDDQYTFVSRPYQPWVVTLKDTRTGQDFWTVEVPVGKQLVMRFRKDEGTKDSYTPDLMEWAFMEPGTQSGKMGNSMPVPPSNARRLDPVIRPTPELPPRMTVATTPSGSEPAPEASKP